MKYPHKQTNSGCFHICITLLLWTIHTNINLYGRKTDFSGDVSIDGMRLLFMSSCTAVCMHVSFFFMVKKPSSLLQFCD